MRARSRRIWAHLSENEYKAFRAKVDRSGLSQEGYLRLLIAGYTPREQPPIEYHRLLRELYVIGNNLNQIAARANSTGFIHAQEYAQNADALRQAVLEIQLALTLPEGR